MGNSCSDRDRLFEEYLAGWSTIFYDRSLSDASLLAREKVIRKLRLQMYDFVAVGHEKRNVNIGSGGWICSCF